MITIRNASGSVLTHFDNNVPEGNPYFEPVMTENTESLISSFSFSVPLQLPDTVYLSKLNQVLAKDKDDDLRMFIINSVYEDWNTIDGTVKVTAEDISISEMNSIVVPPITAMNFADALRGVFNKTGWSYELTANPSIMDRAMYVLDDYTNMRDALVKLRDIYGCQFKFMAQEDVNGKVKRVVKIYKNRGNNTGKYFYYNRDLTGIERDINYDKIYTAVYATYKNEAGQAKNLVNWLPNFPIDGFTKDYSSPLIINDKAHIEWDDPAIYRVMLHRSDLHDPNQVFQQAVEELKKYLEPVYTYKMNVLLLQNMVGWEGEDVNLGDTVWAKERVGDRELGLEARVVEYVYHEDDPSQDSVTFSNYKEIDTTDAKELSNRIYFAYANSADGTEDFSITDSENKLFMGVYTSDVDVQSTDPSVYNWTRIRGYDGNSAPVLTLTATSPIMKFKSNNTPDGTQDIRFDAFVKYMAEDSVSWKATPYKGNVAQPDITLSGTGLSRTISSSDWNPDWSRLVVSVSANGLTDVTTITKISDGANGESGTSIVGFLTNEAVTYAATAMGVVSDYSTGNGQFILYEGLTPVTSGVVYSLQSAAGITMVINPSTGEYAPDKMTTNMAQAIFTASYKGVTVTKSMSFAKSIAGANGKDGDNGTDGKTIWTAYANNNTGTIGFSLTDSNRSYIGTATGSPKDSQPTDPSKYRWSRIKGADATSFSMSGDSNVMKFDANGNIKAGQFITFRAIKKVLVDTIYWEATPYIDNVAQPRITLGGTAESTRTLAVSQWGFGITSIKVKAVCGDFEDTFTVVKLQDGPKGQDGTSTRTWLAYSSSSDGSLDFTTVNDGTKSFKYLGIYNGSATSAPTDYRKYSWMLFKGEAGANNFIHTAYANSEDGSDGFTTQYPKPNLMRDTLLKTIRSFDYSHKAMAALDTATPEGRPKTYTEHTIRVSSRTNSSYGLATQTLNGSSVGFGIGDKVTVTALVYIPDTLSTGNRAFMIGKFDNSNKTWANSVTKNVPERGGWFVISHTVTISDLSTLFFVGFGGSASTTEVESFWLAAMKVEKNSFSTGLYPSANDDADKAVPKYLGIFVSQSETPSDNPANYTWSRYTGMDGKDGTNGRDSITGILTNEAQQLSASSTGVVNDYTVAKGTFQLYDGTTLVTSDVNFEVDDLDGGDASINSTTGFYAVTNVTKDVTNFMFKVTYKGVTIRKTFCVSKSKQGVQGVQGVQGLMGIAFYSPNPPTGQGVVEGATWFKTVSDSDKTILTINTFKDGNWVETSLASGTLAIQNLAAISADLGNVIAGTITGVTINSAVFNSPFDTYTTDGFARRITGTTTISQGRTRSVMTFPNTPVEVRGNAVFQSGPDAVSYEEKDATNRTIQKTLFNGAGVNIAAYRDANNPSQPTSLSAVGAGGLTTSRNSSDEQGEATFGNLYSKGQLRRAGVRFLHEAGSGDLRSEYVAMKNSATWPPNFTTLAQNINVSDVNHIRKVSYSAVDGLYGKWVQNVSGSTVRNEEWSIPPTSMTELQVAGQMFKVGNSDGTKGWIPCSDGMLLQFDPYFHQAYGDVFDINSMFKMASDRKTLRLSNMPQKYRDYGLTLHFRVSFYGNTQISSSGSSHKYTYVALRKNGEVLTAGRNVWPANIGWRQSWIAPVAIFAPQVGDDFTVTIDTNLTSSANFLGGVQTLIFEPFLIKDSGSLA